MNKNMIDVYYTLLRPPVSCPVPKGPEDQICIKFANHLRAWTIEGKLKAVWFHPANEVSDGTKFQFGNKLRAMGKMPGVSDYIFGNGSGMWSLEVKSAKGKLSKAQESWKSWCEEEDVPYCVVKSFEEAETKLKEWGILQ